MKALIIVASFNQLNTRNPLPLLLNALKTSCSAGLYKSDKLCKKCPLKSWVGLVMDDTTIGNVLEDYKTKKLQDFLLLFSNSISRLLLSLYNSLIPTSRPRL